MIAIGIAVAVLVVVAFLMPDRTVPTAAEVEPASDYPVPPLDLVIPPRPRHKLRARATEPDQETDREPERAG
jgi:NADH-quinone oxidoreductase subunit H